MPHGRTPAAAAPRSRLPRRVRVSSWKPLPGRAAGRPLIGKHRRSPGKSTWGRGPRGCAEKRRPCRQPTRSRPLPQRAGTEATPAAARIPLGQGRPPGRGRGGKPGPTSPPTAPGAQPGTNSRTHLSHAGARGRLVPREALYRGRGPAPAPPALRREGGHRRHVGRCRSGCLREPPFALPSSPRGGAPAPRGGDGLSRLFAAPAGSEPVEVA